MATAQDWWGQNAEIRTDGVMEIGKYVDFHDSDTDGNDYSVRLMSDNGTLRYYGGLRGTGTLLIDDPNDVINWNDIWQSGFFEGYSKSNAPESSGWFWGINLGHRSNSNSNKYGGQILIRNTPSSPALYFRSRGSDGTGEWSKVLHSVGNQEINGNLAIGGTNPLARLHIIQEAVGSTSGNSINGAYWEIGRQKLILKASRTANQTNWNNTTLKLQAMIDGTDHQSIDFVNDENFKEHVDIYTGNQIFNTRFTAGGSVGIGTTNTFGYKLAVNGTIGAKEVNVEVTSAWPDYVFEENYNLTPLQDLEIYLKENKHLPGIPDAKTVEEEGVKLGEMNAKLLEKVEELTLYMIDFNKEMQVLKQNNNLLLEQNRLLKEEIEQLKKDN
ncbi:hypothetical protein C900_00167 [Fulvivirga imtechensis AK7]|uniref:Peptidase S74 domain-containing protein n=2 Tax=Fulvivirga TaxID=396811 RepID=L8JIF2_9BACT|nr:hypothetical protein C900_00167 [Fulvivirga imtechensis AK7]